MTPTELMELAIQKARQGISSGQSPFGCAIALDGQILSVSHNTVWASTDSTRHAEMNAIREACGAVDSIFLDDSIVATTCEPCPMCMSALHWARVRTVYYGASIDDAAEAGFNELRLPAAQLLDLGESSVELVSGVLVEECRALFGEWRESEGFRSY